MRRSLKLLVGFVLVAGIAFGVYTYLHRRAQSGRLRLLDAEYSYLASLRDLLQKQANPESQSSVSVFVSASVLNSVLSGADGLSFSLPKSKETAVKLNNIR